MARLVRFTATGPIEIPPQEKSVWICGCGLSQSFPICDGAHKTCRKHETDDAKVYVYDADRKAIVEVKDDDA